MRKTYEGLDVSSIFEPITIGKVEIKNRIALAPMSMCYEAPNHYVSHQQMAYYAARVKGGTGLIITEAIQVSDRPFADVFRKFNVPYLTSEPYVTGWAELVEHVHAFGGKIFAQIAINAGRQGSSDAGGSQPVGPSPIPWKAHPEYMIDNFDAVAMIRACGYQRKIPEIEDLNDFMEFFRKIPGTFGGGGEVPREITIEEIQMHVQDHGNGAKLAKRAGFDGVEIHAPHGYLLHSFISPRSNKRTDEYGGTFENRIRFLLECLHSCRKAVGPDYPVGVRISASEDLPEGFDPHYTRQVAKRCEEEGADYIHLSDGSFEKMDDFLPNEEGQVIPKAAIIKEGLNIPLICPSVHNPDNVVDVLTSGKADMVSMGRQLIADPDWVNKVKMGKFKNIIKCTRCNIGCTTRFVLSLPVRCILNPTVGQEQFMDEYMKRPILPIKKRVWQTLAEVGEEPSSMVE
jgi:2,4-dienoyl-CoA reductase-like NADH-dependent reductase (Old Yellow Enzyme family)